MVGLGIIDHVFIGIGLRINPSFGALNREGKSVHYDNGVAVGLPLHESHDLNGAAGASVNHHLEEREGGDLDALEVVRVVGPGLLLLALGLRRLVVEEDGVGGGVAGGCCDDVVLEFPGLACNGGGWKGKGKGIHCSEYREKITRELKPSGVGFIAPISRRGRGPWNNFEGKNKYSKFN